LKNIQWKATRKNFDRILYSLMKELFFSGVEASLHFCKHAYVQLPHKQIKVLGVLVLKYALKSYVNYCV